MKRIAMLLAAAAALAAFADDEAWYKARGEADAKIDKYAAAVKGGDAAEIRNAMLEVQNDPIAVQRFNQRDDAASEALRQKFKSDTDAIKDAAKADIRKKTVEDWNAKHPEKQITEKEVNFFEATNKAKPGAQTKTKISQDWDVTVQVQTGTDAKTDKPIYTDVSYRDAEGTVNEAYRKAAGGDKQFGSKSAKEVADAYGVTTTSKNHPEAYRGDAKQLLDKTRAGEHYADSESFSEIAQYKATEAKAKGAEAAAKTGNASKAMQGEYEEFRQAYKQYDNIVKTQVEAKGGKVPEKIAEGMEIYRKVTNFEMSPDEAKAALKNLGETTETMTKKTMDIVEAANKLKAPSAPEVKKPISLAKDPVKPTAPDAPAKPGAATSKLKEVGDALGTVQNVLQYGERAKEFTDAANEGDYEGVKEAVKGTVKDVASDLTLGATGAAENVYGAGKEAKEYWSETKKLNDTTMKDEREQEIVKDLHSQGYTVDEAREMAKEYLGGDTRRVEQEYEKMGKDVPEEKSVNQTWGETAETLKNYAGDVAGAPGELAKGVGKQIANVAEGVKDAVEIGAGLTESGVAGEVVDKVKENWSGENLGAGAEVVGQAISESASEAVESVKEWFGADETTIEKERIVDSLTKQGATKEEAEKVAEKYQREKEESASGYSSALRDFKKELDEKSDAEKAANIKEQIVDLQDKVREGDEDAARKMKELTEKYKEYKARANELKNAEGGTLPPPGEEDSIADKVEGGSLGKFMEEREQEEEEKSDAVTAFAKEIAKEREQEVKNEAADDSARQVRNQGADAAEQTRRETEANAAAQQKADSWSTAIANGVQTSVETGLGSFGGALGRGAGDALAGKLFDDKTPHHGGGDHHGHSGGGGEKTSAPSGEAKAPATDEKTPAASENGAKQETKAKEPKKAAASSSKSTDKKQPASGDKCASCGKGGAIWESGGKMYCTVCWDKMYHSGKTITKTKNANGTPASSKSSKATDTKDKSKNTGGGKGSSSLRKGSWTI